MVVAVRIGFMWRCPWRLEWKRPFDHWKRTQLGPFYALTAPDEESYSCPVCDYLMSEPPTDWHICPQCGTEFNYDDETATHEQLRARWEAAGKPFMYP